MDTFSEMEFRENFHKNIKVMDVDDDLIEKVFGPFDIIEDKDSKGLSNHRSSGNTPLPDDEYFCQVLGIADQFQTKKKKIDKGSLQTLRRQCCRKLIFE